MSDANDRHPVDALVEEYVARYRAGDNPSIADYADRHPQWAGEIRELFSAATLLSGITLVLAASSSSLLVSGGFVLLLGLCAGAVYVLGFTLLHENVDDELRGRAFSGLYTLVRMCVLLSFVLGPFLATLLHGLSRAVLGPDRTLVVGDVEFLLPGVRLALFLAGIIMVGAGVLIRPLLGLRREALRIYLKEVGQSFRDDETNQEARFLRNRLRARLMPVLAELNPAIVESLARTAELLEEEDRYLDELARREVTRWARPGTAGEEASVRIPAANFNAMPLPLRRRAGRMLLAQAGGDPRGAPAKAVADLIDLAGRERPGGGLDLPGGVRITRQEGLLILDRADAASRAGGRNLPAPFCVDMPVPGEVTLPDGRGTLRARRLDAAALAPRLEAARRAGELDTHRVFMDGAALGEAPRVRSRLRGDAFRPMGGAGSRKVSDYLIDRKVPRARRDGVPLVVGTAGIAWVVGFRAAEEYRVTPESRDVVELEWDRGEGWWVVTRRGGGVQDADQGAVRDPGLALLLHGAALGRRCHRPGRHPQGPRHGSRGGCERSAP